MHENAHKQHSQQHEHQHEANDFIARIPSVQVLSAGWLGVRGGGQGVRDGKGGGRAGRLQVVGLNPK